MGDNRAGRFAEMVAALAGQPVKLPSPAGLVAGLAVRQHRPRITTDDPQAEAWERAHPERADEVAAIRAAFDSTTLGRCALRCERRQSSAGKAGRT